MLIRVDEEGAIRSILARAVAAVNNYVARLDSGAHITPVTIPEDDTSSAWARTSSRQPRSFLMDRVAAFLEDHRVGYTRVPANAENEWTDTVYVHSWHLLRGLLTAGDGVIRVEEE